MKGGSLIWIRDGEDTNRHSLNPLKYYKEVKMEDNNATYQCVFRNVGIHFNWACKKNITFKVQYPPLSKGNRQVCIKEGDNLNLTCSYKEGNPPIQDLIWHLPFNENTTSILNPLLIENKQEGRNNPEIYTCSVFNTLFNGEQTYVLVNISVFTYRKCQVLEVLQDSIP
ncbi:uncharacterized protein [Ptychodera flava]|uniref:uncharacterized protein n=1 Tax=Ptychodera flava TaxID=63121 RepID=UPI00396A9724